MMGLKLWSCESCTNYQNCLWHSFSRTWYILASKKQVFSLSSSFCITFNALQKNHSLTFWKEMCEKKIFLPRNLFSDKYFFKSYYKISKALNLGPLSFFLNVVCMIFIFSGILSSQPIAWSCKWVYDLSPNASLPTIQVRQPYKFANCS